MPTHARVGPSDADGGVHARRQAERAARGGASPADASVRIGADELGDVRHDLKNVLTTLRHGCTLVGAKVAEGSLDDVQLFLDEMRSAIDKGRAIVERLR
jgi:hypothetical protein